MSLRNYHVKFGIAAGAALLSGAGVTGFARSQGRPPMPPSWRTELTYTPEFFGQLGPPLPTHGQAAAGSTGCGPVMEHCSCLAQLGPYGGLWLRIGSPGGPRPPDAALLVEALRSVPPNPAAATYVALNERCVSTQLVETLLSHGFDFHHYRRSPPTTGDQGMRHNEFVYYRWEGDQSHNLVPAYATATEGVGGLLLSPDEKQVLLIWEYGCWKMVTGSVDEGEPLLSTLAREAQEEVGITLDGTYTPRYMGGWHAASIRDKIMNDHFSIFAVRSASKEFNVDGVEVSAARWFDRCELLAHYKDAGGPALGTEAHRMELPSLSDPDGRTTVSTWALRCLSSYDAGDGMAVRCVRPGMLHFNGFENSIES